MAEIKIGELIRLVEENLPPTAEKGVPLYIRLQESQSVYSKSYELKGITVVLDFDSQTNELVGIEFV